MGIILFGCFFNLVLPDSFRAIDTNRTHLAFGNALLTVTSLLLAFGIFNYTEFSAQKDWTGFPYRLFAMPVPTWLLVASPMAIGVAAVELVYLAWIKLVFAHDPFERPEWFGVLIGAYMVFYQTILWSLAGFRTLRIIALGLIGTSCVGVAILPGFEQFTSSPWLSEKVLSALLVALALAGFVISWICVARQRRGGGRRGNWFKALVEKVSSALPRRTKSFSSAAGAQFWFEWRHSGWLLPGCIAAMLIVVVGPLSWVLRKDSDSTLWILGWTLGIPVILAAPVGKSFSKPNFWSSDLALPTFQAVRPLATGEMVVIKMKVAALSAAISWLLLCAFLSVWLPLWADLAPLSMLRVGFWMIYDHSVYPQYVMAGLSILAGMLLTWKFLVGGLWIGLSGNRRFFVISAAVYCSLAILGILSFILLFEQRSVREWIREDPNRLLSNLEWLAALAVIAKVWLAAFSWRRISPHRVRNFLLIWFGSVVCLLTLALLAWAGWRFFLPLDSIRLGNLLILIALLAIPFARLGLAPSALARNRHA
jgi:hypothetical protein